MASNAGLARAAQLWNWRPHSDGQAQWLLCDAPVKVAACGRRWGKSESMAIDVVLYALDNPGSIQMVIAPTADQTSIIMQEVADRLYAAEESWTTLKERRTPYHNLSVMPSGLEYPSPRPSTICARTASFDGRGIRGRKAHRVIVDEAAFVPDEVMDSVITPLLADYDGSLVLISTPTGRNHFWRAFERGQDPLQPRYKSFQFPSSDNPTLSHGYLDSERATKPERVWLIEYEAQFADSEGLVFRNVAACCIGAWEEPRAGRVYIAGLDLGRMNDFTVLTVIDIATCRLVHLDRFNVVGWEQQAERIAASLARYNSASLMVERNNVGDVVIELLRARHVKVTGFDTTASSKPDLVDSLAVAFERRRIILPPIDDCRVLTNELMSYAYEKLPSGHWRMGAPSGSHDDCVMSLALAWKMAGRGFSHPVAGPERQLPTLHGPRTPSPPRASRTPP